MRAYVYAILVDGKVRYIGKGSGGRLRDHLRIARAVLNGRTEKAHRVHYRLAAAIASGAEIITRKVLVNLSDTEAFALEKCAIDMSDAADLWNTKGGGDGGVPEVAREVWTRRQYRMRQKASRASEEYKTRMSAVMSATRTDAFRASFGAAVKESWRDPEKVASRMQKRRDKYATDFKNTTQAAVLNIIAASNGISTADIKKVVPNARGALEKLTAKNSIEKRGGKYGLFYLKGK